MRASSGLESVGVLLAALGLWGCSPAPAAGPEARQRAAEALAYERSGAGEVWRSRAGCEAVVARGGRAARARGVVRLASWNIRWFPDGAPDGDPRPPRTATDVAWLACALTWLDADVIALQEILTEPSDSGHRYETARAALLSRLGTLTGSAWEMHADTCAAKRPDWLLADEPTWVRPHNAVLWRRDRIDGGPPADLAALNALTHTCAGYLRPGHGGHFRAAGVDFHLYSVHAKSGPRPRDWFRRRDALDNVAEAFVQAQRVAPDPDVIFAGDWNTMGCPDCDPPFDAAGELSDMDRRLAAAAPGFRRVTGEPGCTEYYRGHGGPLDHFVLTGLTSLDAVATAQVHGYCALAGCSPTDATEAPAYQSLSDHCPVVLDVPGVD